MASEASNSDFSSLFAKKKGKKGKRTAKGLNLNIDSGLPKLAEEKPKIAQLQEILGGPDPSEDDGWADVVEKKSVVATGGKQVSDLIDMTTLMVEEESTASKLEKKDIKQAFHDARTVKEVEKKEDAPAEPAKEEQIEEATKPKGLSGNIFGGGAGRPGGTGALSGGWLARMQEKKLKEIEQALNVDNTSAFPSLADAMSGPVKPKQVAGGGDDSSAADGSRWVRRGSSTAASAAIKAALGRQPGEDDNAIRNSNGNKDGGGSGIGEAKAADAPSPPAPPSTAEGPDSSMAPKTKVVQPVWVAPRMGADSAEAVNGEGETASTPLDTVIEEKVVKASEGEGEKAVVVPGAAEAGAEAATVETDKDSLVKQFGKKKKKKKKTPEGGQAGGEP